MRAGERLQDSGDAPAHFAIPIGQAILIYAPLLHVAALVNRRAARSRPERYAPATAWVAVRRRPVAASAIALAVVSATEVGAPITIPTDPCPSRARSIRLTGSRRRKPMSNLIRGASAARRLARLMVTLSLAALLSGCAAIVSPATPRPQTATGGAPIPGSTGGRPMVRTARRELCHHRRWQAHPVQDECAIRRAEPDLHGRKRRDCAARQW